MTNAHADKINQEACAWIAKLHGSEPSQEELAAMRDWMQQSPAHDLELRRMAKRWDELNVLTELAVPVEVPRIQEVGWAAIFMSSFGRKAAVGALVATVILALGALWSPTTFTPEDETSLPTFATAIGEQKRVTLPDNSTALLNTNSQLRVVYTAEFRNVYLTRGEAHFDVSSHPNRPFRVFAGNGMVRAVGTAFSVHLKEKVVEVTVTEGSVQINTVQDKSGSDIGSIDTIENLAVVKAGQSAVFDQLVESIESIETIDRTEISRKLAWQEGLLRFSGAPLDDVVEEVSRYTPISIVIVDPALRDLPIGGFFEVGETEKMFEALESGFGVRVDRINNNVVHLSSVRRTNAEP